MFKAVLSLSGIGGFILTLGMAIDSNIILYERFMEELNKGRHRVELLKMPLGMLCNSN